MRQISVIVPVYKVEPYLRRCVDSILIQTYTDFETILVDDGSPDGCGSICDEYALQDDRIIVFHQSNGGLSAARNTGIDYTFACSDSKWLTFIDSDDWIHPRMIDGLLQPLLEFDLDISICTFKRMCDIEPITKYKDILAVAVKPEELWCMNRVNATIAWGKIYRRSLFELIRYPIGIINEDEFTTYKILFECPTVLYVDIPLYFYYLNQDGIMQSQWNPKKMVAFVALEEQMIFFKNNAFNNAFMESARAYIRGLELTKVKIKNIQCYKFYYSILKQKMRKAKTLPNSAKLQIKRDSYVYSIVHPKLFMIYNKVHAFVKTLQEKGLREAIKKTIKNFT